MRLLLINPNTSESITDLVANAARRAAAPGTEIIGVTAAFGARYIGSRAAAAIAGHAALDAYARHGEGADGVMLACFGDPGLLALREASHAPVTGMAEASCHVACTLGQRFSIITGGLRWGPMLEEFVAMIGLKDRLASVRTVAPTGAEIAANPEAAYALLADACNAAIEKDGADIVILGGAGLLGIAEKIADRASAPLIDCMQATMGALEAMVRVNARKAERGPLAKAPPVETIGLPPALTKLMAD
ncbi:aspartate/glutamate racemase family protein [Terrarubrum flagellatum]|uniref:aspartate/glutamate racemase family protein n=1 Tax=Terrirubrum flagellatum TaxID=2895980 RepID=UPI0031450855